MDKLFRFSKLAAIIILVLAALSALCFLIDFFTIINITEYSDLQKLDDAYDRFFWITPSLLILEMATIVVFGSLIYKFSANGSPLRTPAVIGIISAVIVMVRCFMAFSGIIIEDFMMYRNTLVLLSSISIIGFLISFIWLSRYFNERKIKLLCIAYPVLSALPFILSITFLPGLFVRSFYFDGGLIVTIDIGMIVIDTVFTPLCMIILSAFYYMFYKMSTK